MMATVIWGSVESEMFICSQLGWCSGVRSGYSSEGGDKAQAWWDVVVHGSSLEFGPNDVDASQMGTDGEKDDISKSATQRPVLPVLTTLTL